jgi:hypothetical protein
MEIREYCEHRLRDAESCRDVAPSISLKTEDWNNPIEMIRLALCELERRKTGPEKCDVCAGEGHCGSRPCICGGSGLMVDAIRGMRLELIDRREADAKEGEVVVEGFAAPNFIEVARENPHLVLNCHGMQVYRCPGLDLEPVTVTIRRRAAEAEKGDG